MDKNLENQKHRKILEVLEKDLLKNGFKKGEIVIKEITNSIYSIGDNINISYFVDENGKVLKNLVVLSKFHYFNKAAYLTGYREVKDSNGAYNMYSIKDIDSKSGKPILGAKPVDKYSYKYFEIWKDIDFQEDKLFLETFKIPSVEGNLHKMKISQIEGYIKTGVLRIKDLNTLVKQGQVDKVTFLKYLPQLQKLLLTQIGDTRFEALGDIVVEEEIKAYLEVGYIDKNLARECYKKIKERDEVKRRKEKQKNQIHSETHYGVENEVMVG